MSNQDRDDVDARPRTSSQLEAAEAHQRQHQEAVDRARTSSSSQEAPMSAAPTTHQEQHAEAVRRSQEQMVAAMQQMLRGRGVTTSTTTNTTTTTTLNNPSSRTRTRMPQHSHQQETGTPQPPPAQPPVSTTGGMGNAFHQIFNLVGSAANLTGVGPPGTGAQGAASAFGIPMLGGASLGLNHADMLQARLFEMAQQAGGNHEDPTPAIVIDSLERRQVANPNCRKESSWDEGVSGASATVEDAKVPQPCAVCQQDWFDDRDATGPSQGKEPDSLRVEVVVLPCAHCFHEGCIVPWLKTSRKCPLCRVALPSEEDIFS